MLITPEFGPRVRIGVVLTELELEPDPIYDGPQLCNRCMACVRNCPGGCISETKTVKVNLAGHEVEWGEIDTKKCDDTFYGGMRTNNPDEGGEYDGRKNIKRGWHTPFFKRPRQLYTSGQAICGAMGCTRACMISLEARGVLKNKFKEPFRRRKPCIDLRHSRFLKGENQNENQGTFRDV